MLTVFGKFCRKLRIDRGELLKDMAQKLNVSPAYLSAVEVGKRNIPKNWRELLINAYSLQGDEISTLDKAIDTSAKILKINLEQVEEADRSLAVMFARNFQKLDEDTKKRLADLFTK